MPTQNRAQQRQARELMKQHGIKYMQALAVVRGERTLEQVKQEGKK